MWRNNREFMRQSWLKNVCCSHLHVGSSSISHRYFFVGEILFSMSVNVGRASTNINGRRTCSLTFWICMCVMYNRSHLSYIILHLFVKHFIMTRIMAVFFRIVIIINTFLWLPCIICVSKYYLPLISSFFNLFARTDQAVFIAY